MPDTGSCDLPKDGTLPSDASMVSKHLRSCCDKHGDGTISPEVLPRTLQALGISQAHADVLIQAVGPDVWSGGRIRYDVFLAWLFRESREETRFPDIGVLVPELLLPRPGIDMAKWSTIACDQYTSEPGYWQRVKDHVGDAHSMLHLTYPEVYMPEKRDAEIIGSIHSKMAEYLSGGIFQSLEPGFVLVDRKTPAAESRKGLVVALDLELYSFEKGSQSLIRATEKTIEARLPPRIKIREQAPIESPHILVLLDDPGLTVIEPLFERRQGMRKLYDFELMENSGHLTGYHVTSDVDISAVVQGLRALSDKAAFQRKYGTGPEQSVILFPVGDGNHSLATAKRCWEAVKAGGADENHPSRHALVELINIHDPGLAFHPIHRLVEDVNVEVALDDMQQFFEAQGSKVTFEAQARLSDKADVEGSGCHRFECLSRARSGVYTIESPQKILAAATLDSWLNGHVSSNPGCQLDYVHEEYTIQAKASSDDRALGFLLPSMDKNDLVKTVLSEGALPRKTFSMGHAPEKRFYCECRRVIPA